jgi:hypothetical protein
MSARLPARRGFKDGPVGRPVAALRTGSYPWPGWGYQPNLQTTPVVLWEPKS